MTESTIAPVSFLDSIVNAAAILEPRIKELQPASLAQDVAMMLISSSTTGQQVTFEQAVEACESRALNAADIVKLQAERKERERAEALKAFSDVLSPMIEEQALAVAKNARPTIGYRILVRYDANIPVLKDGKESGEYEKNEDGSLKTQPVKIDYEPMNVKRLAATSGGSSGRTAGVFRLRTAPTVNVQLGALAKTVGQAADSSQSARVFLESKGYTISETAEDVSGVAVKWVDAPAKNGSTGK